MVSRACLGQNAATRAESFCKKVRGESLCKMDVISTMAANDERLILILGDQLSRTISSLGGAKKDRDTILIVEVHDEATYVRHHKKKIAFLFSAMRHFAEDLRLAGWTVRYVKLDDPDNTGSFTGELKRAIASVKPSRVVLTEPAEYRVRQMFVDGSETFSCTIEVRDDDRFICTIDDFKRWADGRKELRMENFYREVRKTTGLLMEGDKPAGGKWNFDKDNRKPAKADLFMPEHPRFEPDAITKDVLALVEARFGNHFGDLEPFRFAVTREDAEAARDWFLDHALARFGDYQDAMLIGEKFLYHSLLSMYLNCGLLDARALCEAVEARWRDGDVPINAAEGFIRQIIGWREYVRGIYWLKMPEYEYENALGATRRLPDFYWTGATDMRCLSEAIGQTKQEAYAHHIQRLMVTGNFAMLAGVDPHAVHEWYLIVYADAYEWVEMPNVIGMSQFADGGLLGSKPYASSANYIDKMSDYCGSCAYDRKTKTEENSCPYNYLYWDFLARNEDKLRSNHRMRMIYGTWEKMKPADKKAIRARSRAFLDKIAPETA